VRSPSLFLILTPIRKASIKKEKGVKKAIKSEVKAEPLSSAPSTPLIILKRPRATSAGISLRKRPRPLTRALKVLNSPAEKEDAEEEQAFKKLLKGSAGASEVSNSEV
jgi:hypothetical protein